MLTITLMTLLTSWRKLMTDLTPNDLSHLSDEEFNALCPQGHHATGPAMTLSPTAQAVLDAFENASDGEYVEGVWVVNERTMLAAALRAVADYAQRSSYAAAPSTDWGDGWKVGVSDTAQGLLAIAAELEAQ